ncbi:MAG: DNA replication and repair protein RecF [Verrucomicrobia bacterium]|jgi:DNA replication and repair protein RecF|nr:MAG: DNA replication and repair protein RecF [Verrucomicrobiota bacterium]
MPLSSLRLRDFRCYHSLNCPLTQGITVFTGDNAQGKTSLLEAVCVLLRLQSPRTTGARDLIRFSADSFGVAGTLDNHDLRHTAGPDGRSLTIDGTTQRKPADYLAASGLVVWFGNSDRDLITDTSEIRRRYLDFLGSQLFPEYKPALRRCEAALRSRNFLLRRDASPPWRQIDAYTRILADATSVLSSLRSQLLNALAPEAAAAHAVVSSSSEILTITYLPGSEPDLPAQLDRLRDEELRRRVTAAGPHRDDFSLAIDSRPANRFGSEGQQRTVALALKLAQAAVLRSLSGRDPILLLDDIFGELDPSRRNALLSALPPNAQKLVTTTHLLWTDASFQPDAIWKVSNGSLEPVTSP